MSGVSEATAQPLWRGLYRAPDAAAERRPVVAPDPAPERERRVDPVLPATPRVIEPMPGAFTPRPDTERRLESPVERFRPVPLAPVVAEPTTELAPAAVRTPPEVRITEFDRARAVESGTRPPRGESAVSLGLETGRAMQRLLNANGANLDVDGVLGSRFRAALAEFRRANRLGDGSGYGTGIDQRTIDALIAGARTRPAERGRTFAADFQAASPAQQAAGNMLAILNSQDPKRFEALMRRAGVQVPANGEITPAMADKVIAAIRNPTRGHGLPIDAHTNARLSFDTTPLPNGEWNYESARVAADIGTGRARPSASEPPRLTRNLDRAIFGSDMLRRAAEEAGIPLHHYQAMVAVESDGTWLSANSYGAVGYSQVTRGLADGWRIRDGRMTFVGWNGGSGQRIDINNHSQNLRLGAHNLAWLYDRAARAMNLPTGGPRTNDRIWSTVHASYNAGMGRLDRYVGTPNFAETRNHVDQVRAYIALFGARARFTPPAS